MTDTARHPRRLALWLGAYLGLYAVMQWLYQMLRGSPVGHAWIDMLTVQPASELIASAFPDDGVFAQGSRLVWPHGRLQMATGCDGFDVLALYVPAVLVASVGWRKGLLMMVSGTLLLWLVNQLRLLALYASFQHWRDAFDAVHTVWGPLAMLGAMLAFYSWQLRRSH